MDLFDYKPTTRGTRREAFEAIAPRLVGLRLIALETLARVQPATAQEAVVAADLASDALRPRLSELLRDGLVKPTGQRRKNPSGKSGAALCLTDAGYAALRNWRRGGAV